MLFAKLTEVVAKTFNLWMKSYGWILLGLISLIIVFSTGMGEFNPNSLLLLVFWVIFVLALGGKYGLIIFLPPLVFSVFDLLAERVSLFKLLDTTATAQKLTVLLTIGFPLLARSFLLGEAPSMQLIVIFSIVYLLYSLGCVFFLRILTLLSTIDPNPKSWNLLLVIFPLIFILFDLYSTIIIIFLSYVSLRGTKIGIIPRFDGTRFLIIEYIALLFSVIIALLIETEGVKDVKIPLNNLFQSKFHLIIMGLMGILSIINILYLRKFSH